MLTLIVVLLAAGGILGLGAYFVLIALRHGQGR